MTTPQSHTDERYGEPGASTPWSEASRVLADAPLYWFTTVRETGPHTVPLVGLWDATGFLFVTGRGEEKWRNLGADPRCSVTTGRNDLHGGTDVTVEGRSTELHDPADLERTAAAFGDKYGDEWAYRVEGDGLLPPGQEGEPGVLVRVVPETAYAFAKEPYSQTRYRFRAAT